MTLVLCNEHNYTYEEELFRCILLTFLKYISVCCLVGPRIGIRGPALQELFPEYREFRDVLWELTSERDSDRLRLSGVLTGGIIRGRFLSRGR